MRTRLESSVTEKPDSIELLFCKPFESLSNHPMSEEISGYMIRLLFSEKSPIPESKEREALPFLFQMIISRVQVFNYTISDFRLIIFLAIISKSPGTAVMYLTYLQYVAKNKGLKEFNLDSFIDVFPYGFPSDEDLHRIWDSQKVSREHGSDNLLDYSSALQSLLIENPPFPVSS